MKNKSVGGFQIELINLFASPSPGGPSVNRKRLWFVVHLLIFVSRRTELIYIQFEERQIGIAVIRLRFALLGNIFLEYCGRLRVISVETVEDGVDIFGPVFAQVESESHSGGFSSSSRRGCVPYRNRVCLFDSCGAVWCMVVRKGFEFPASLREDICRRFAEHQPCRDVVYNRPLLLYYKHPRCGHAKMELERAMVRSLFSISYPLLRQTS